MPATRTNSRILFFMKPGSGNKKNIGERIFFYIATMLKQEGMYEKIIY
jgi:hypothetical protein